MWGNRREQKRMGQGHGKRKRKNCEKEQKG